ncbi:hypothetical protein Vretimale_19724, partial [Volvox reticuliferus]
MVKVQEDTTSSLRVWGGLYKEMGPARQTPRSSGGRNGPLDGVMDEGQTAAGVERMRWQSEEQIKGGEEEPVMTWMLIDDERAEVCVDLDDDPFPLATRPSIKYVMNRKT